MSSMKILFLIFPFLNCCLSHPRHHFHSDAVDSSPVIPKDSLAYRHVSYLNPNYEYESNYVRDALSLDSCSADRRPLKCDSSRAEEYRSYDGSCNNLENPHWGRAGLPYKRMTAKNNEIGEFQCGINSGLPDARTVSLNLVRRGNRDRHSDLSMYIMLWGQLIDHDILISPLRQTRNGDFLDCCHPLNKNHEDCCPVKSSSNDPFYGASHRPKCQSMLRSRLVPNFDCTSSDVENGNTALIDGSFIYGSTKERALNLRTMENGRMKVSVDKFDRHFPPINGQNMEFGDIRGDSTWATTMIVTAWLRNHNVLSEGLRKIHRRWNDEKLYQEARKINVAMIQHVTYTEFLDGLLGSPNNLNAGSGYRDFYDPTVDPTATLEFADAGFRLHTMIGSFFHLVDSNYRLKGRILLRDVFRNPVKLMENSTYDDLIRGCAVQPLRDFNNMYSPEMTEWMFRKGNNDFGLDIVALTIQRGRDHQLPGYIHYREKCGLGAVRDWNDLTDLIPADIISRMRRTYKRIEDIDLFAGVITESALFGSEVGPTMHCMIRDQFRRMRDGDRFFYTRPGLFTQRQLRAIQNVKLADILCGNSDDSGRMSLPIDIFEIAHPSRNPIFRCSDHIQFDIHAWR